MEGGRGEARNTWQAFFCACVLKVSSIDRPFNMSLFKYFQTKSSLPKPDGPLSTVVPSSSIVAANKEVKQALDKPEGKYTLTPKCGTYESVSARNAQISFASFLPERLTDMYFALLNSAESACFDSMRLVRISCCAKTLVRSEKSHYSH